MQISHTSQALVVFCTGVVALLTTSAMDMLTTLVAKHGLFCCFVTNCADDLRTMVESSCGPIACWILARTSSLATIKHGLCIRCVVSCGGTSFQWIVSFYILRRCSTTFGETGLHSSTVKRNSIHLLFHFYARKMSLAYSVPT